MIVRFLLRRFSEVPEDIQGTIREITDLDRLDTLADTAAVCQSLDEIRNVLERR